MLQAKISMRYFKIFFAVLIFALGPLGVLSANAGVCTLVGGLGGQCHPDCETGTIGSKFLVGTLGSAYEMKDSCKPAEKCCVPLGNTLCSAAATIPMGPKKNMTLEKANCVEKCVEGKKLSEFISLETCSVAANQVCCGIEAYVEITTTPAASASAAAQKIELSNPLDPFKTGVTFYTLIQKVISAFLGLVGGLALAVFVYAGILWMTAGGDEKKVQTSKDAMKYAVMGLAMIAFAYTITSFVIDALTGSIASQQTQEVEYAEQQDLN
jgi:hypothetical protein